ncbi:uncharacterized protein LOC107048003 [Diachasma alloeum]|uniref:uncharacterized protein LOC107048003 n=1 Tax=Diachasma alloeum TaxID=454923 RepID=UPI00073820D0|nr:uncharacterized protein LOC107048003 [Diachasma alloeum]
MSGCIERHQAVSPMTGSTVGQLQPQVEEPRPSKTRDINKELVSPCHRRMRQRMTPVPPDTEKIDQPIQLTPVWEHVVRTQQFPPDIDKRSTFTEISERLRDPEWEVRQHALRVLIDVLPTLPKEQLDNILSPVVPELTNNLGHLAPAVRKGAIDALRVYLVCSEEREIIVNNLLRSGLSRQDPLDPLQISITQGLILSAPALLYPSATTPPPSYNLLSATITALAHHLIQINHQEAALKSLLKIRDIIGPDNFAVHLSELNPTALKDFQVLCEVYKVSESPRKKIKKAKSPAKSSKIEEINGNVIEIETNIAQGHREVQLPGHGGDFETSGSRVLLETEIKLNEDTAITMTISEEKDNFRNSNDEVEGEDDGHDEVDDEFESKDVWIERRKTPRRVHFGGEIVKMRTPDSDDSEALQIEVKKTKIPLPIAPVTKLPLHLTKPLSNPGSPNLSMSNKISRRSRSASISPKREFYVHDGSLSPKKGILTKNNNHVMTRTKSVSLDGVAYFNGDLDNVFGTRENRSWSFEVFEDLDDDVDPRKILHVNNLKFEKKLRKKSSKLTSPRKLERNEGKNVGGARNVKIEEASEMSNKLHDELHNVKLQSTKLMTANKLGEAEEKNLEKIEDVEVQRTAVTNKLHDELPSVKLKSSILTTPIKSENNEVDNSGKNLDVKIEDNEMSNKLHDELHKTKSKSSKLVSLKRSEKNEDNICRKIPDVEIEGSENSSELHHQLHNELQFTERNSISRIETSTGNLAMDNCDMDNRNLSRSPSLTSLRLTSFEDSIDNDMRKKSLVTKNSPRKTVYESFPRKERNYILMELSSPVKMSSRSREVSPEGVGEVKGEGEGELKECEEKSFAEKSGEGEGKGEANWEDLGLVTQDVLDDLHNKEDWRARVRGLERVASALRTSSALIAIEPRLGSLLQAVLGGERSCRVAAAAMSVARVVIAGVSEESLKRRLPQVAWGLSRQGGPSAAQLARLAMLRLRPALFLEQLLQPHCIDARNAKTRENALQLLIFSLVTFPSTEFKVENVANKVALMVGDRRRRVRQAALDTLAVLAQIYEPEEVLQAGNRAAKQLREGTDMVAAIRARLARKSLPMVSADGLVVYGLQISPTVQIATGPDVDWIVAGSGSVSPGTGRARGQVIPPNVKGGVDKNKNEQGKSSPSSRPNFVAQGISLHSKNERPLGWQFVPPDKEGNNSSQDIEDDYRNESPISIESSSVRSRYSDTYSPFLSPSDTPGDTCPEPLNSSLLKNDKDVIMKQRKTEENFHRRMDQIYAERRDDVRLESRIPVPQFMDRHIVVRHSTAYQRRRRQEAEEAPPSSAPHTSAGPGYGGARESEISRRYRSDRIKFSSRPASEDRSRVSRQGNSPIREGFESVYRNGRRRSVVRSSLEPEEAVTTSVESRRNSSSHSGSMHPAFSQVQETDPRTSRLHTPTTPREKTNADDEDNEINRYTPQSNSYHIEALSDQISRCSGTDHVPYGTLSDSSNGGVDQSETETRIIDNGSDESNEGGDTFGDKSFDVITDATNPSRQNLIDQVALNILSSGTDSTDQDKDSSEKSGGSNDSDERIEPVRVVRSASSVVSNETNSTDSTTRISGSPVRTNGIKGIAFDQQSVGTDTGDGPDISLEFDRGYSTEVKIDIESRVRASIYPETKTHFQQTESREVSPDGRSSSVENDKTTSAVNSLSIIVASRPHSRATTAEYREPEFQPLDYRQSHADETTTSASIFQVSRTFEGTESIDVTTEQVTVATSESFTELPKTQDIHVVTISKVQRQTTPQSESGVVQDVVKIHEIETTKRLPSRVPRSRIKSRPGVNKITPFGSHADKTPARFKPVTLQCISQLESNDWEITIRGLKSLSTIARQQPNQLDSCPPGTVGRLLGRHVRNLRSQVARTACLAAGDVFGSQARCIDQDLDDIAGPLLQRTADTNKFLRADSNSALDRMIEHIPPHKTITVIVHRGASHQNAVVRAATARLLASVVDRVGADVVMSLPREVRDKLLGAGAKLLGDGNLDARNHAKSMFKRLSRCDGFRRALTDAVPEATLRHIDKTLRSL